MHRIRTVILGLLLASVPFAAPAAAAPVQGKPSASSKARSAPDASVRIDVNRADAVELQQVPGIGPALAKRIVEFRKQHGPFASVDEILKVRGIGEKSLAKLRPHLTVGAKRK